jgi:hypothetical protein
MDATYKDTADRLAEARTALRPAEDTLSNVGDTDRYRTGADSSSGAASDTAAQLAGALPAESETDSVSIVETSIADRDIPASAQRQTVAPDTGAQAGAAVTREPFLYRLATSRQMWVASGLVLLIAFVLLARVRWNRKKAVPLPDQRDFNTTLSGRSRSQRRVKESTAGTEELREKTVSASPRTNQMSRETTSDKKKELADIQSQLQALQETRTIVGGVKTLARIGRYVIEQELGRGAMGSVYKAWDPKLDRTVAIKKVEFDLRQSPEEIDRTKALFYRKARAAGGLSHANIVIIYDVEEDENACFIVMEYLKGRDLQALLSQQGKIALHDAIMIFDRVCSALDFAHRRNIVHRDIKPSNIMLTDDGKVKVADFGIAKLPKFDTLFRLVFRGCGLI